jgi:uncharacterized protein YndB with AHSA1/START domain
VSQVTGPSASCEIALAAPLDLVWAAWTDPTELSRWQAESVSGKTEAGGRLHLFWGSLGASIELEVTAVERGRCLALRGGPPGASPQELVINFSGDRRGCKLQLEHRGFSNADAAHGSLSGWHGALALLELYLGRYFGRERRCAAALTAAVGSFTEVLACFTQPERLSRWLGNSATPIGEAGSAVSLKLYDGGELRGSVLARTARELTLEVPALRGAIALRCLSLDGTVTGGKMVGAQISSWAEREALVDEWREMCSAAVERLGRLLGTSGGARGAGASA